MKQGKVWKVYSKYIGWESLTHFTKQGRVGINIHGSNETKFHSYWLDNKIITEVEYKNLIGKNE